MAWPDTCVLLPLALMLHGEPQPGPLGSGTERSEINSYRYLEFREKNAADQNSCV
jgi:hypothetical protein